ncbi:tetratricopeptide repeat protein [Streptomyces sp. NPDC057638]|uniref:tetratricopeptide repeat protein n=1 Tax=Streptomyces sp. NPDC057638 TaxID=3346190 RepID=UPI0036BF866E
MTAHEGRGGRARDMTDGGETRNVITGDAGIHGHAIQAREVHGGIHVHADTGPSVPVPRQLPPLPPHFVSREEDLDALSGLLGHGQPLVVISGPAGVGKTTLASRWLHGVAEEFPDGLLYADLRGYAVSGHPAEQGEVLGSFLRALGARGLPADLAEQTALWRSSTAGRRVAVLLDNALSAAQVRPLLPGGPGCVTVVTSRRMLSGLRMDGAAFHQVGAFGAADAVELLRRGIGAERVARELAAAREIVTLCAGLPLAVCLAAARLAARPRQPMSAYARALTQETGRLTALEVVGEATVAMALDASYGVLAEPAARLYRTLGALPLPTVDARTAAAACGESLGWAERGIDELVDAHLLEDIGPDECRFHDLVRVHARDRALADDTEAERAVALRRAGEWYLRTATAAQTRLTPHQATKARTYVHGPAGLPEPFADETGALEWLDSRKVHLMTLVRTAVERGWHAMGWQIVDALWPLFLRLRHYGLWIEAHEIGLEAARGDGDAEAERQMLNSGAIGLVAARRTETALAWYEDSLRAARAAGDPRDEGQALHGLGSCHRDGGRPERAESYLNAAISVWEGCGYPRGAALARTVLGEIALDRGDPRAAIGYFTDAHARMVAVHDPHDAARALAFLGRARCRAGEYREGVSLLRDALAVFTTSGAAHWQARSWQMLAESAREAGDEPTTGECCARAIALYEGTSPDDAVRLRAWFGQGELPGS